MYRLSGLGLGPTWSEWGNDLSYWWNTPAPDNAANAAAEGNDQLRAEGVDLNTGQVKDIYKPTFKGRTGVDPNDPDALKKHAAKVRADAAAQYAADLQKSEDAMNAPTPLDWKTVALVGAGVLAVGMIGSAAVSKALK